MKENFKLSSWCLKVDKVWFITSVISREKTLKGGAGRILGLLINSRMLSSVFQVFTVHKIPNNVILLCSDRKWNTHVLNLFHDESFHWYCEILTSSPFFPCKMPYRINHFRHGMQMGTMWTVSGQLYYCRNWRKYQINYAHQIIVFLFI